MYKKITNVILTGILATTLMGLTGCGSSMKVPKDHIGFQAGPVSFVLNEKDLWAVQESDGYNLYDGSKVEVIKVNTGAEKAGEITVGIDKNSKSPMLADAILDDLQQKWPSERKVREIKNGVAVVEAVYTEWRQRLPVKSSRTYPNAENDKERSLPHYVIALSNGKTSYFYVFLDKEAYEQALVDVTKFDDEFSLLATDGSHEPNAETTAKYIQAGSDKLNNIDDALETLEIRSKGAFSGDKSDNSLGWSSVGVDSIINDTDKNIQSARVAFTAYNNEGKWTDFYWWGLYYGPVWYDNMSDQIPAGKSIEGNVNYIKNQPSDVATVKAIVKDVTFDDGSTWENPLYNVWAEKYVAKNQKK